MRCGEKKRALLVKTLWLRGGEREKGGWHMRSGWEGKEEISQA